jgi:hypothetical protein
MVAGLRPSNCPNGGCESSGNHGVPGLVVALVSEAIGLGLAIPGIVKIAKQSDAESEASAWYFNPAATSDGSATSARPARSVGVGVPEPSMRPTGFSLPLLSGTF